MQSTDSSTGRFSLSRGGLLYSFLIVLVFPMILLIMLLAGGIWLDPVREWMIVLLVSGFVVGYISAFFFFMCREEAWLSAEFEIDATALTKRLPTGIVISGRWDELVSVRWIFGGIELRFAGGVRIPIWAVYTEGIPYFRNSIAVGIDHSPTALPGFIKYWLPRAKRFERVPAWRLLLIGHLFAIGLLLAAYVWSMSGALHISIGLYVASVLTSIVMFCIPSFCKRIFPQAK